MICGDGDSGPECFRDLNGVGADATAPSMDQYGLCVVEVGGGDEVGPHGARRLGQCRRCVQVDAFRNGQQL